MSAKDNSSEFTSLKGHLLLAMPQMNDPRFHRAVIFMAVHDEKGAMGMVINNPLPSPDFAEVLRQVGVSSEKPLDEKVLAMPVLSGGPVQSVHGFLLHSSDFDQKNTIHVDDLFSISGTVDALRSIVNGYRPELMLFTLGYAGWGAGQLEKELQDNVWLTAPASHEIVFMSRPDEMWENAFALIGVNPGMLSGFSGRA
ncbi:MAG TPA: YqgE/AlgH family protein [Micavibrio sp.]|nr:YqgE/AlgH family protein [Micavibrio sp.]